MGDSAGNTKAPRGPKPASPAPTAAIPRRQGERSPRDVGHGDRGEGDQPGTKSVRDPGAQRRRGHHRGVGESASRERDDSQYPLPDSKCTLPRTKRSDVLAQHFGGKHWRHVTTSRPLVWVPVPRPFLGAGWRVGDGSVTMVLPPRSETCGQPSATVPSLATNVRQKDRVSSKPSVRFARVFLIHIQRRASSTWIACTASRGFPRRRVVGPPRVGVVPDDRPSLRSNVLLDQHEQFRVCRRAPGRARYHVGPRAGVGRSVRWGSRHRVCAQHDGHPETFTFPFYQPSQCLVVGR